MPSWTAEDVEVDVVEDVGAVDLGGVVSAVGVDGVVDAELKVSDAESLKKVGRTELAVTSLLVEVGPLEEVSEAAPAELTPLVAVPPATVLPATPGIVPVSV